MLLGFYELKLGGFKCLGVVSADELLIECSSVL